MVKMQRLAEMTSPPARVVTDWIPHKFVKGLEASTITLDFLNDREASNVLQTLQAAWVQLCH